MPDLTAEERVVALLEWGDVAEADAAISEAAERSDDWKPALWQAARALMEGRFHTCARQATEAAERGRQAGDPHAAVLSELLIVALRREQERRAEAETLLRALLDRHPTAPAGAHAQLALLVGEMGRDGQARVELSRLLPREPVPASGRLGVMFLLADLAAAVEAPPDELALLARRLGPHVRDFAVEEGGAVVYGSVAFAMGRLAQASGHPDQAIEFYEQAAEAYESVGAPVLLAHTHRHLAALLRTRGADGDWDRAVVLLSEASRIYSHLAIDGLAAATQAVLARAYEGSAHHDRPTEIVFQRHGDGWIVGPARDPVRLRDARGLRDIARLLGAPRKPVHVVDLLAARDGPDFRDPAENAWNRALRPVLQVHGPILDPDTRAEYEARLTELAGELVEAERSGHRVRAALARAERDALTSALGGVEDGDLFEQARRAVNTRIRIALDRIEQAEPVVGRHLRLSIRTGTFCSYEPDEPVRWSL